MQSIAKLLSGPEEWKKDFVDAGVIPQIVVSLSDKSLYVRNYASLCLAKLASQSKIYRRAIANEGAIPKLSKLFGTKGVCYASYALFNLSIGSNGIKSDIANSIHETSLVSVLYSREPILVQNSAMLIASLASGTADITNSLVKAHAVKGLFRLLYQPTTPLVKGAAITALRHLAARYPHIAQNLSQDEVLFCLREIEPSGIDGISQLVNELQYVRAQRHSGSSKHFFSPDTSSKANTNIADELVKKGKSLDDLELFYPKESKRNESLYCPINNIYRSCHIRCNRSHLRA